MSCVRPPARVAEIGAQTSTTPLRARLLALGHQLAGCGAEQPEDQARGEDRDDDRQPERGVEGLRVRVARGVGQGLTLLARQSRRGLEGGAE